MLAIGAATLVLTTAGVDLFMWLADERYGGAAVYIPWLNVAVLLQCAYSITASSFFVTARTGLWMKIFVVAAVMQVAACYVLIPWLGTQGAPFAMILTNGFLYVGSIVFGWRLWRVPYRHGLAIGVIVLVTGLSLARQSFSSESWLVVAAADVALIAAFAGVALALRWALISELRRGWQRVSDAILEKVRGAFAGGGEDR